MVEALNCSLWEKEVIELSLNGVGLEPSNWDLL